MSVELPQGEDWKEGDENDITVIRDCYCVSCGGNRGVTYMLPTKVPMFREILVTSFSCEDCNFRNSEVTFGGEIQEKGERIQLTVTSEDDLNRQLIKSDSASLMIPKLDFEIPPATQKGTISTIEGMLTRAAENLNLLQPERLRLGDVDNFHRCREVIENLRYFAGVEDKDDEDDERPSRFPFDIILDDPAGNSFLENPHAPLADPKLKSTKYFRSATQDMALGLQPSEQAVQAGTIDDSNPQHKNPVNASQGTHTVDIDKNKEDPKSIKGEVLKFATPCPHCYRNAETDMCVTDIPHFKEVIIMSLLCEHCGFKSNEIKGGGAIPKFGSRIILSVESSEDLSREVLKSDTAGLNVPELELELDEGGLDGLYTTVEGLLNKVHSRLESANPFGSGDSASKQHLTNDGGQFSALSPNHQRYMKFLQRLKDMADGKTFPFTVEISDPLANSFVGPIPRDAVALALQAEKDGNNSCYDAYVDSRMTIEEYERTMDQNEILGLNDMKTENYGEDGQYYGTDAQEELPDRIRRPDIRGPDHPVAVGKAPVEGDNTVMGAGSANFAVPSLGQRGTRSEVSIVSDSATETSVDEAQKDIAALLHKFEYDDDNFRMNDVFEGPVEGMVYKDGAQGLGYYTDMPLSELSDR